MGADELFDCEAFKAIANRQASLLEGEAYGMGDAADKREEYAQLYERVPVKATDKQIAYIRILCRDGWLAIDDFPSSRHFRRKKNLTMSQAHALIQRGKKRMVDDKQQKKVARERGW